MKNEWKARNKETGEIVTISSKSYGSRETTIRFFIVSDGIEANLSLNEFLDNYEYLDYDTEIEEYEKLVSNKFLKEYFTVFGQLREDLNVIRRRCDSNYYEVGKLVYKSVDNVSEEEFRYTGPTFPYIIVSSVVNMYNYIVLTIAPYKGPEYPIDRYVIREQFFIYPDRIERNRDASVVLKRYDKGY